MPKTTMIPISNIPVLMVVFIYMASPRGIEALFLLVNHSVVLEAGTEIVKLMNRCAALAFRYSWADGRHCEKMTITTSCHLLVLCHYPS